MLLRRCFLAIASSAGVGAQIPGGIEPDLAAIDLPILATARERPEELMAFLFDPATPYPQALAAASRCGGVLPLRLVEPLLRARDELHHESGLHWFGLAGEHVISRPLAPEAPVARQRTILGRAWTVPEARAPYPMTWAEACAAPWPWRAQQVAERAWSAVARSIGSPLVGGIERNQPWLQRRDAWYAECLRWTIDDDGSAQRFFEATSVPAHGKSLAVLARWRRILLDARTPLAAGLVANALGEVHRQLLYGEPDARLACQILLGDGLRLSPHLQARWGCARQLGGFTTVNDVDMKEVRVPCPPEALLAAGDLGAAAPSPDASERWNQIYTYVFFVVGAVDRPPFAANQSLGPDHPDVPGLLTDFAAWWREQRPQVEAQVLARAERVQRLRQRLEELAR